VSLSSVHRYGRVDGGKVFKNEIYPQITLINITTRGSKQRGTQNPELGIENSLVQVVCVCCFISMVLNIGGLRIDIKRRKP
jgi:hypothetical protein